MSNDPYNLYRFLAAQQSIYSATLAELRQGRKTSHWMWFIFPQIAGLGRSSTAQHYAIASLDEARAYLEHATLGDRLRECVHALEDLPRGSSAAGVLGEVDAMKLRSSLTLFEAATGETCSAPRWTAGLAACATMPPFGCWHGNNINAPAFLHRTRAGN